MEKHYDLIVVGAGAGGITAAVTGAGFGKRVLLIDKSKPGGECTWSGCIPSKALIHQAAVVHEIRSKVPGFPVHGKEVLAKVRNVREDLYQHENPEALALMGIDFLQGKARFTAPKTLSVDGEILKARRIVIATGSSPSLPPIPGLAELDFLTNESVFELDDLPGSMIILGGGPIGVELAQAFHRLGVRVDLVEMAEGILFREDPDLAAMISERLAQEGVGIHTGTEAIKVSKESEGVRLTCRNKGSEHLLSAETLLVAVGRKPNIDSLDLDKAGIRHDRKGIAVNRALRTSSPGVYAVGDVVGPYRFSHAANAQGILATQNAILPITRRISYKHMAWVTFTDPEFARAGMTEEEARKAHGNQIRVYDLDLNELDRTKTGEPSLGRVKIILGRRGQILGAAILAERAGEMISEIQLAKTLGVKMSKFAGVVHPYPTFGEVFQKIGKRVLVDNLLNHPVVKLFRRGA